MVWSGWLRAGKASGLLVIVLLAGGWQAAPTAAEINSILNELSGITGFPVRRQLPFALITREQVNKYLQDEIRISVKPGDIRAEEITLKKFGFAPPDFDLKKTTIDLLTEQAAAFYDFKRKKLFISDWAAVNMRDTAIVHELAHALADQNFSIRKFTRGAAEDGEMSMARESVVEGQASWLMVEVEARRTGKSMADTATARQLLVDTPESPDGEYPVYSKAPLYLRKTLLFPYAAGGRFQQAVFEREGQAAFAKVFERAPVSSAQIEHPERYFAGEIPATPVLPKPWPHMKAFVKGSLGELETRILLEQYVSADVAQSLGPLLRGSRYRVDENRKDHRMTLVYVSEWADEEAAGRYFVAYQTILRGKWHRMNVTAQGTDQISGLSEDGYFRVALKGRQVRSEEGFAAPPV